MSTDINHSLNVMYLNARTDPDLLHVSIEDARKIRHYVHLGAMYYAHARPRRKLRRCFIQSRTARLHKARAHIHRVERAERIREEKELREIHGKV